MTELDERVRVLESQVERFVEIVRILCKADVGQQLSPVEYATVESEATRRPQHFVEKPR